MLAERIKKWPEQWEERGRQEARLEAERRTWEDKRETVRHLLAFGVLSDEQIAEAPDLMVDLINDLRPALPEGPLRAWITFFKH